MFKVNDDWSIYVNRGDAGTIIIPMKDKQGNYEIKAGDVLRIKVYAKKACDVVLLQKNFGVERNEETYQMKLDGQDTKIGDLINKPTDYWYEVELNPGKNSKTIIGYDDKGPKIFRLYPEAEEIKENPPTPEEIGPVDKALDLTSKKPVENQAITKAFVIVQEKFGQQNEAINVERRRISDLEKDVDVEKARIDNIVAGGEVNADAEMADLRVGADGVTYDSAGTAVRTQITNLKQNTDDSFEGMNAHIGVISKEISGTECVYHLKWETGSILTSTGQVYPNRKDRIHVAEYFPFDDKLTIKGLEGRSVLVCFYNSEKTIIGHQGYTTYPVVLADYDRPDAAYFRLAAQNIENEEIPFIEYVSDYVEITSTVGLKAEVESLREAILSDVPKSMAVTNVLMKAKQLTDVKYTTKATLPYQKGDFAKDTELTGIVYSSARVEDKLVGINISLHTFMTAIYNPKSVIYTKKVYNPGYGLAEDDPDLPAKQNALTYYGIVCSALVCHCLGIPYNMTTYQMVNYEDLVETSVYDIQLADCMVTYNGKTNHVILIVGIKRDKYGRIVEVETTESTYPTVKTTKYTFSKFLDTFVYDTAGKGTNYRFFRYKKLWQSTYTPSEYVAVYDEQPAAVSYPDIITNFGDKATVVPGTDITANVIDGAGYTEIEIYKDGTLLSTHGVEDVTIPAATAGMYEFRMIGVGKTSSTYILIADCNVSCADVDGKKRIYFSSTNSVPQNWSFANTNYANLKTVEFTEEDIARGYFDVDLSEYASNYKYIKVYFKNEFGSVSTIAYQR